MFGRRRKGFFGPGWGHGPWQGRVFEKGDLKYVILDLLEERPSHGYEVIRSLDDIWGRVGGGWDPEIAAELHGMKHDLAGLAKLFGREMHAGRLDQEKMRRIQEVISGAAREIEEILDDRETRV